MITMVLTEEEKKEESKKLDAEQKKIDALYAKEGLTDEVLDMHIALNQKRHKYNIPDPNHLNDEGWLQ